MAAEAPAESEPVPGLPVVQTTGRTDLAALFRESGLLAARRLTHTPFLVFVAAPDAVRVEVVDSARALAASPDFPDDAPVMVQWSGQWRSEFFRLTVGDVRRALAAKESGDGR